MTLFSEAQFLAGKVAIVTGANRGIGESICKSYLDHGAKVIACVRDIDLMWPYDTSPGQLEVIEMDLSDEESIKNAIKQIRSISKKIDILVNNAGTAIGGTFQMSSLSSMKDLFETNLFGPILLSQLVSRLMAKQKEGVVINITSSSAQSIERGSMVYGTSKAALERVTKSMAMELAELGIRVNAIAPGVTDTEMGAQMDQAAKLTLLEKSYMKNMANPQDIANAALFLSCDLSKHMTGQILHVDGGLNLQ